jgi:hypothetical protein
MNGQMIVTQFLITLLLFSSNLYASSKDVVGNLTQEQEDILVLKANELEKLYSELAEEVNETKATKEEASIKYFRGCSKGFKKLGTLSVGLIQAAFGAFVTGAALVKETVVLDLTYLGIERDNPDEDPFIHSKELARITNDLVADSFNGYSDKKCAELNNTIEKSRVKIQAALGERDEIKNAKEVLKGISQVPRDAIKDSFIEDLGSNTERGVAQSR